MLSPKRGFRAKILTLQDLKFSPFRVNQGRAASVLHCNKPLVYSAKPSWTSDLFCAFVAKLHRRFDARRRELLVKRTTRQREFDAGTLPDFLPETQAILDATWTIAQQPADMLDRRVEITGPTDRKMVINAHLTAARLLAKHKGGCWRRGLERG